MTSPLSDSSITPRDANSRSLRTPLSRQDADWLLDAAIDLGIFRGEMDRGAFRRGLADIVADYSALPPADAFGA